MDSGFNTMIKRKKIKQLLYQYIVQHPLVIAWFADKYPEAVPADHIAETGSLISKDKVKFPAIRFRLNDQQPIAHCNDCDGQEEVFFEIAIQDMTDTNEEGDELIDLIREILFVDCGEALGRFSESEDFSDAVGEGNEMRVWEVEEITSDQIRVEEESTNQPSTSFWETNGLYTLNLLRFRMSIADY